MYETVLWATDGSSTSDGALAEAVRLLRPGGRLIAFHADERFLGGRAGGLPITPDESDRHRKLVAQVEQLKADGVDAELVVETTYHHAAGEITKAAEDYHADVIVCGSRGFGLVAGAVAGSVAMRLPHLAACPVVVVSEKAAARTAVPAA
jgi:nucleotide-binding universal stress UspA family protein